MRVKIIQPGEWYKNYVGMEFDVKLVNRNYGFNGYNFSLINYEVENFREIYKELKGKYPEDNEEGQLIALAIHQDHAEIITF